MSEKIQSQLLVFDDQLYTKVDQEYSSGEAHLLFMNATADYFNKVEFLGRKVSGTTPDTYVVSKEIAVQHLPFYTHVFNLFTNQIFLWREIKRRINEATRLADLSLTSWPHPISLAIIRKMVARKKIPVILIRQNIKRLVELRYSGFKRRLGLALIAYLEWKLRRIPVQPIVLAVGDEMYREFSKSFDRVFRVALPIVSRRDIVQSSKKIHPVVYDKHPLRILFVGRLDPEKGLGNLVSAVAEMRESGLPVRATLVGDGPSRKALESQAHELGIASSIELPGYVEHGTPLFNLYRNSDLFVIPSLSEGFPKVIPEAMAFRLPVVATPVGGIPEIIHHEENGLLVSPGSPQEITDAVKRLVQEPELTNRLLENATRLSDSFTIEHWLEEITKNLAPLLTAGKRDENGLEGK